MSTIEKLSISGIRSFGPNTEQEIKFQKPLTVICGANGTGKSTITSLGGSQAARTKLHREPGGSKWKAPVKYGGTWRSHLDKS